MRGVSSHLVYRRLNHILAGATIHDEPGKKDTCLVGSECVDLEHGGWVRP